MTGSLDISSFIDDVLDTVGFKQFCDVSSQIRNQIKDNDHDFKKRYKLVELMFGQVYAYISPINNSALGHVQSIPGKPPFVKVLIPAITTTIVSNVVMTNETSINRLYKLVLDECVSKLGSFYNDDNIDKVWNELEKNSHFKRLHIAIKKITNNIQKYMSAFMKNDHEMKDMKYEKYKETQPHAPLGQYAFPGERFSLPHAIEPHTELEDKILLGIKKQVVQNHEMSDDIIDSLFDLKNRGLYKDILKEPTGAVIYRGMNLVQYDFRTLLRKMSTTYDIDEHDLIFGKPTSVDMTFVPKAKNGTSSWTTSKKVAQGFSKKYSYAYRIILHASVEENRDKLLSLRGLYDLTFAKSFQFESEVLAKDKIKVFAITVIKDENV
jgi:hypothetical protein